MNASISALLQITAAFLMGVQHSPTLTPALTASIISSASRVIQVSTQALAPQPAIPETPSTNIWPDITRLRSSLYLNSNEKRVVLGNGVSLLDEYTSFGDLNGDGLDEAVAVVIRTSPSGASSYALAAFVNQNGILFNIADVPFENNALISSHRIDSGIFEIKFKNKGGEEKTLRYKLLGNELVTI